MKPEIIDPAQLATARFTSKVRLPRNIDLISGIKANHDSQADAVDFMATGHRISTSVGWQLDAWGERFDLPRGSMGDDEYRLKLLESGAGATMSQQSRPSIGAYIGNVYGVTWLTVDKAGTGSGAVGAIFNRVPLGRMIYMQCAGMAPNISLTESLVAATFAASAYSAATPPNRNPTDKAPALPGNVFSTTWGGLSYVRTERAIRVSPGITIRVKAGESVLTRQRTSEVINQNELVSPCNTFITAKPIEVING